MKCNYAVTFEYLSDPPETIRGTLIASNPQTIASRAIRDAKKQIPKTTWNSMSVLIERVREKKEIKEESDESND